MNQWKKRIGAALLLALVTQLCGCVITVDQMYVPPRRSESYLNLQAVMDECMTGLDYCAPLTGENQQSVQMVDLTGDGAPEMVAWTMVPGAYGDAYLTLYVENSGENVLRHRHETDIIWATGVYLADLDGDSQLAEGVS